MQYISHYESPIGRIVISSNQNALTGLWFEGQKHFATDPGAEYEERLTPVNKETEVWLDIYFNGKKPDFTPPVSLMGTDFQMTVWSILCSIPYGKTMTYGGIARIAALKTGREKMSAQAAGGAIGRNPVSIIVPCHRVIACDGSLTGYAGGLEKKGFLLKLENAI